MPLESSLIVYGEKHFVRSSITTSERYPEVRLRRGRAEAPLERRGAREREGWLDKNIPWE